MRRCGNLWEELTSFENLYRAARTARRGKRDKPGVEAFEFHLEKELVELGQALRGRSYRPGPFRTFTITDPKPRLISAAPYRDRIVHHALCNVLEPVFERSFVFDSCDDFVVLDNDKQRLAEVRDAVEEFLLTLRLWLHPKKRAISRVEDGLPLLGYRVWPHRRRLQRANVRRFTRRLRKYQRLFAAGSMSAREVTQRVRAWIGHAMHADTWRLRGDLFERITFVGPAAGQPRAPRRFLEQQREEHPFRQPQQEPPGQPEPEHRVPCGEHRTPPH